jgi:hypothetical protein
MILSILLFAVAFASIPATFAGAAYLADKVGS